MLKVNALIKLSSKHILIAKHSCLALCVGVGMAFNVNAGGRATFINADNSSKPAVDDELSNQGMQQTLRLNFSPENREKLRKALDEFAKTVDRDHQQIEDRRRAMQESIEARFFDADNDGDGTIDRQEATEKLPQVARLFSQIDINQDNVISLDELVEAQARILERRRTAETLLQAQKLQAAEAALEAQRPQTAGITKPDSKPVGNNLKKRTF